MRIRCVCGKSFQAYGKTVKCPKCKTEIIIVENTSSIQEPKSKLSTAMGDRAADSGGYW